MQNLEDVYKELQGLMPASTKAAELVPASVIILWQRSGANQVLVYLVKRAATMRFLPGFWTFPGGKQESEDLAAEHTACRELFEETGVRVRPEELLPGGRWRTPLFAPLRFDTHYFYAQLPAEQVPDVAYSEGELSEGCWWEPKAALDAFEAGLLLLPSPVRRILVAMVPGIDGLQERTEEQAEKEAFAPRLWEVAGGVAVSPLRTPTLPPATHTNCYVIGTGELLVIDPATYDEAERQALCEALDVEIAAGRRIAEIWLTHHHGDHIGSAEFLSERYGAPICAHVLSAERLRGKCRVDKHLLDGETRQLAGPLPRAVQCVFTPGHAPGHLCFFELHTMALVAGDMVASEGTILIDPSEGDMSAYLESLQKMRELKPRLLLPAHGIAVADPERLLTHYIAHRLGREAKVLAALRPEPRSPANLVKEVYADTPVLLHGLAERSLLAHLVKLAGEGRAVSRGTDWTLA